MENSAIIKLFQLTGLLLELHEENVFKIRGYQNAVFNLEKVSNNLSEMSLEELAQLEGVGKGIASKIVEIGTIGSFKELDALIALTPKGIIEILGIKGLGPKKVRTIWKELGIESKEALLEACNENRISGLKGFGEKTQESIKQSLLFNEAHKEKFLYAEAEATAFALEKTIKDSGLTILVSLTGEVRRKMEVIDIIQIVVGSNTPDKIHQFLDQLSNLEKNAKTSSPFVWRGKELTLNSKIEIKIYPEKDYWNKLYINSGSEQHLKSEAKNGASLLHYITSNSFTSEEGIFESLGWQFIIPEMREGYGEIELAKENKIPELITYQDLKGVLHNHSTYSDGAHTLEQMATYCKELGFEYLGISDHSKTAFYAGGLNEKKVEEQHREIDELNKKLAPFKIFKGIESDILSDGELDYSDEVLSSFDFIVASVHSNLKMTEEKATQRLIKAIENPHTTMLGHPTGRLLLRREGYPINYKKVIDACAANFVSIEINANPWRLDLDWRWVKYAIDKGIMISINPDAHEMPGYHDMNYGVYIGRKAGLSKEMTLNALSLADISTYFEKKKVHSINQ